MVCFTVVLRLGKSGNLNFRRHRRSRLASHSRATVAIDYIALESGTDFLVMVVAEIAASATHQRSGELCIEDYRLAG